MQSTVGATATMTGEKTPVPEQVGTAEADLTYSVPSQQIFFRCQQEMELLLSLYEIGIRV